VKAEEYEAAVNKVLEAFGLSADDTCSITVEPHRTIVEKVKREDDKRVVFSEVINRDDIKTRNTFNINVASLADHVAAGKEIAKALKLYEQATGQKYTQ
jgi:hypothetical protein